MSDIDECRRLAKMGYKASEALAAAWDYSSSSDQYNIALVLPGQAGGNTIRVPKERVKQMVKYLAELEYDRLTIEKVTQ